MIRGVAWVVKKALFGLAVEKELVPAVIIQLHPVSQASPNLFLHLSQLLINVPEATCLDGSPPVVGNLHKFLVKRVLPKGLPSVCVVKVGPAILIFMFSPAGRQGCIVCLFGNPDHICFSDVIDSQTMDVREHFQHICLSLHGIDDGCCWLPR